MSTPQISFRFLSIAGACVLNVAALFAQDVPPVATASPQAVNVDIRAGPMAASNELAKRIGRAPDIQPERRIEAAQQALAALQAASPGAEVTFSATTGGAQLVRNLRGSLTQAAPGAAGFDIVRDFVTAYAPLYGLSPGDLSSLRSLGESVSRGSGLRMVRLEQVVNGLRVFQSETRFTLDREGRLLRSDGLLVPGVGAAGEARVTMTAPQALAFAAASVGISIDSGDVRVEQRAGKQVLRTSNARITDPVPSELIYFALAPGVLVPAWMQVIFTDGPGDFTTIVDATTGTLLWRKNIRQNAVPR